MATSPGWAQLGSTIAGGNKVNGALAYETGESLGAKTQDALAQARARIDENTARANIGDSLKSIADPGLRAILTGAIQAHVDPAQILNSQKTSQEVGYRGDIVNPQTSDSDVARRLLALNQNADIIKSEGEGQVTNRLHPDQGITTTPLGESIAGQHKASTENQLSEAALHRDQVAHPEKYRTGIAPPPPTGAAVDGSQPLPNDATLLSIARGMQPAPIPGSLNYNRLGGESAQRRIEWFAQHPEAGMPAPAATGVTPVAPGVTPPAAGGTIKLPTETPTATRQPAYDSLALGVRRTALNDLSRKNGTGGNDDALNRTAGHLDVYEQLMQNSGNTNFVAGNQLKNWFQKETGQAWPGQVDLAAHILGTEIVKSMTSIGAGTGDERLGLAGAFSKANSKEGAAGAIDTAQRLLREQAVATNQRIGAAGVKDYYTKYLTPTTRRRLSLDEGQTPTGVVAPTGAVPSFKTEAEAEAAGLKPNTKILINGRPATWQ